MKEHKVLYRSQANRLLGGVCGGIGEYFNVDPNIIRIIWAALVFFWGAGILLYIVAWILLPAK